MFCLNDSTRFLLYPYPTDMRSYNMKLERGVFKLPEIDSDDPASSRGIDWSDLIMIVKGLSPSEVKRCSRWEPKK